MRTQLIVALVLLVVPCIAVFAAEYNDINNVKFVSCYDGDTCTFNLPNVTPLFGREIPVRLFGIDTPEMKGQCEAEIALAKKARDVSTDANNYISHRSKELTTTLVHSRKVDKGKDH